LGSQMTEPSIAKSGRAVIRGTQAGTAAAVVRSDLLLNLRRLLECRADLRNIIGSIAEFHIVVDANVLIGDILWLVCKRKDPAAKSALQECILAGTFVAYVTNRVTDEVERHLRLIAVKRGISADVWTSEWLAYKSLLRIQDPEPFLVERYVNGRDPDDAPTIALADAIAACGILTEDRDVKAMGGRVIPITFKLEARDYSRKATVSVSIQIGGYIVTLTAIEGVKLAASALQRGLEWLRALPDGIKVAAVIGLMVALLHPKSRSMMLAALTKVGVAASDAFPLVLECVASLAAIAEENRATPPMVRHL
jgi:predicted nucleic acid-binding protein